MITICSLRTNAPSPLSSFFISCMRRFSKLFLFDYVWLWREGICPWAQRPAKVSCRLELQLQTLVSHTTSVRGTGLRSLQDQYALNHGSISLHTVLRKCNSRVHLKTWPLLGILIFCFFLWGKKKIKLSNIVRTFHSKSLGFQKPASCPPRCVVAAHRVTKGFVMP